MNDSTPLIVEGNNLSIAWGRILLRLIDHKGTEISPLVVSLGGFGPSGEVCEDGPIRESLDRLLETLDCYDVETVAFTIFPQRYWEMAGRNRSQLFQLYRSTFPRLQAMNRRNNGRGLYFARLVMFGSGPEGGNQLEWILKQSERRGVRRSMLQAAIFDPSRDHVASAQLGFPCLQQISLVPGHDGLVLNAFYATQQLLDKGYGNYLGLARLGVFMAHEMGMPLQRLNIFVGVAKLERITKRDSRMVSMIKAIRAGIDKQGGNSDPSVSAR